MPNRPCGATDRAAVAVAHQISAKKLIIVSVEIHFDGRVAQLNSASDFGSEGCRFESCHGHEEAKARHESVGLFYFQAVQIYLNKLLKIEILQSLIVSF